MQVYVAEQIKTRNKVVRETRFTDGGDVVVGFKLGSSSLEWRRCFRRALGRAIIVRGGPDLNFVNKRLH